MKNSIIDILLDRENTEPIVLRDENGRDIEFDQIAVIAYEQKIYCILKPTGPIDDVAEDEVIVFYVDESDNEDVGEVLRIELDNRKADAVFEKYLELLKSED